MLARGRKQRYIAKVLGVCEDTIGAWKKLPGFADVVAQTEREDDAQVWRALNKEWLPSVNKLAEIRDLELDSPVAGNEEDGPAAFGINPQIVGESRQAAKALADMRFKLLMAKMAQQAKSGASQVSAEEQAAAIQEYLRRLDEATDPPVDV